MRKFVVLFLFSTGTMNAIGQNTDSIMINKIAEEMLVNGKAYENLKELTKKIGGRLSGSPQMVKAEQWGLKTMKLMGADKSWMQECMVPHWVRGAEHAELIEWDGMAPGTTQKVVLTALGGSVATPETGLTAEVIVVNTFDELTALGRDKVAGKIVLFNNKFDSEMAASGFGLAAYGQAVQYRFGGAMAAARLGA